MPVKVAIIAGTRPEAIKLLPIRDAIRRAPDMSAVFIASGQHREMLASVFDAFGASPDIVLDVMAQNDTLSDLFGRLMSAIQNELRSGGFDLVIVQGDTSTALAGALAAHYNRIPVIHVEAGLRTNDKWAPFPEESHRRMIGAICDFHFAATPAAADALSAENLRENVHVVGNTVVDALLAMKARIEADMAAYDRQFDDLGIKGRRYVLATIDRKSVV